MIRLILVLLLLIAAALVVALARDRRSRQDTRIDRLRWAFLHGTPLAGYSRVEALEDRGHSGGLRFRLPASWVVDVDQHRAHEGPPAGGRRLRVEVVQLAGPAGAGTAGVLEALKGLVNDREPSLEVLPNGNVLMKTLETRRDAEGPQIVYVWRLARALEGGARVAVFRVTLEVEAASDVIAQSDLATVDREVRAARFADEASG